MKKRSFPYSNPNGTSAMESKKQRRGRCVKFVTEELVTDIITRLPAKDLMRFKCVSKSWSSLIRTDSFFHRLQVHRTASPSPTPPFLLVKKEVESARGSYSWSSYNYLIDLDSSTGLIEIHNPFHDADQTPTPDAGIVGSCRGLVLFQQRPSDKMAVSNPITRKHRMLPPNPAGDANVKFCGFGYDRVHDRYKLVTKVIWQRELIIYDLNSDTWHRRPFPSLGHSMIECRIGAVECVDGAVYWCLSRYVGLGEPCRDFESMMCFVLAEDEFHKVETPDFGEIKNYPNLTVLDGRLGLVIEGLEGARLEVWMIDMECDSNKTYSWRWTKILSLSCPKAMLPPPYNLEENILMVPLCLSGWKTRILYDVKQRDLFWYDMVNKEFHEQSVAPLNGVYRLFRSFVPTLVGNGIF